MSRRSILVVLVAAILASMGLVAQALAQDDPARKPSDAGKGRLAEIRGRIVQLERQHRQNMDTLQEALFQAQQQGDTLKIKKIQKQMDKARSKFRSDAAQIQTKLRSLASKAGFDEFLQEHKRARREVETKLKTLRRDLNQARIQGDTKKAAKARTQIQKVEKAFLEKLRRVLDKVKAAATKG